MENHNHICMKCMKDIGDEEKCPYCGFSVSASQQPPYLPLRANLAGRFIAGKAIGRNGEGIDYIGWDNQIQAPVYIRELLPDSFSMRSSLDNTHVKIMPGFEQSFSKIQKSFEFIWSKLASFKGKYGIIKVIAVFEENNTSYAVYEHFTGMTLDRFLSSHKEGHLTWQEASRLFLPLLSALEMLHGEKIVHLGISPKTVFVTPDGKLKINGFCTPFVRNEKSNLSPQLYSGYTPYEQYDFNGEKGFWSDTYSVAALLYRTLIGVDPIDAKERAVSDKLMVPGKFAQTIPSNVIDALIGALQISPSERTADISSFRSQLFPASQPLQQHRAKTESPSTLQKEQDITYEEGNDKKAKKSTDSKSLIIISACVAAVVALIILGVLFFTVFKDKLNKNSDNTQLQETVATVQVPNFIGRSYIDIQTNEIFNSNFKITPEYINDETTAKGYITSQSIDPDTTVEKGTEIKVYVSQGTEQKELPDVKGMLFEDAVTQLEALGFVVEKTEVTTGGKENGEILFMSPLGGHSYNIGSTVSLQVYVTDSVTTTRKANTVSTTKKYQVSTTSSAASTTHTSTTHTSTAVPSSTIASTTTAAVSTTAEVTTAVTQTTAVNTTSVQAQAQTQAAAENTHEAN